MENVLVTLGFTTIPKSWQ